MSTGFILSDAAGPVIIAERAQNITALKPADLPGFTVALGEPICSAPYACTNNVLTQLIFNGDSTVSLGLNLDSKVTLGSQRYMARNAGAGHLIFGTCKDLERASPWSMWRGSY